MGRIIIACYTSHQRTENKMKTERERKAETGQGTGIIDGAGVGKEGVADWRVG